MTPSRDHERLRPGGMGRPGQEGLDLRDCLQSTPPAARAPRSSVSVSSREQLGSAILKRSILLQPDSTPIADQHAQPDRLRVTRTATKAVACPTQPTRPQERENSPGQSHPYPHTARTETAKRSVRRREPSDDQATRAVSGHTKKSHTRNEIPSRVSDSRRAYRGMRIRLAERSPPDERRPVRAPEDLDIEGRKRTAPVFEFLGSALGTQLETGEEADQGF
jgi:hypothetical protein